MKYNPDQSKDGAMDHERGRISGFHDVDSGGLYGTAEGDKREGSHAPDVRVTRGLGSASKPLDDETERWLRDNDPNYKKKGWNG